MAESAIKAVIGKIMDCLADPLKKQVNYLCCYSSNVQTLSDELEELKIRHQSVQQKVDTAMANSEVITPEVDAWLRKVEELKIRSDEIRRDNEEIQRSSVRKFLPLLQYSLSRKARKAARDCVELRNTNLDTISNPVIPAEIPPVPTTSLKDGIMHALKDPHVYSIGIWGVGGVGKTVMAKRIEEKVRNEKSLFEHIVMVVVSQQMDLAKLQNQIAEGLGLTLSEESPVFRQRKLHRRLMAEESILIILDDLWERLDLEEFGIPSQTTHACCKLILTSRNRNVLASTGVPVQNLYKVGILTKEESWRFFRDNAGITNLDDDDSHNELIQIARKVERECNGLPLALKIVASALKCQDTSFWYNAVQELNKSAPKNISGVLKDVYQPLKYSFNALESEEQKVLFLLCCLFPEDHFISIEELLRCGVGLGIFKGLENLVAFRDKVETVLKILLSRSLLIEERMHSFYVRMHDVIRDVGIWIATEEGMIGSDKEKHLFMISHGLQEWPLMREEDYICISLLFSHQSIIFPESIVCPKLEFLRLDFVRRRVYNVKLPENFFSGMSGLRYLEAFHIGLLPPSIGQLNNLRTLYLEKCNIFETVSVLGKLINLEILSLIECEIEILPIEIGELKKLKQMHILYCGRLRRIAFGVISGLARLEELVILGSFENWDGEAKTEGGEDDNACLCELDVLKKLTTLKVQLNNARVVPRQKPFWIQNLQSYNICVSTVYNWFDFTEEYKKVIVIGEVKYPLGDWVYDLANDAECLHLSGSHFNRVLKGLSQNFRNLSYLKELKLKDVINTRYLYEGLKNGAIFPILEKLTIWRSDTLKQISHASLSMGSFVALRDIYFWNLSELICLWNVSVNEQFYLKNLRVLRIDKCNSLSYMFSLSIGQSLVQLSNLIVSSCETMKEMFKKDDGALMEFNKIELLNLEYLFLKSLKNFCHFCNEIDGIEFPKLRSLTLRGLPNMKMTKGDNYEVRQRCLIPKVAGMNFNFCRLTRLDVEGFGNFKYMFSPSIISEVPNLRILKVKNCSMLEQVIGKDDESVGETISFPYLRKISLKNLPSIRTFCYNAIQMSSLELLKISQCPLMLKFVEKLPNHISNSSHFLNGQVECPKLKELIMDQLNISTIFSPLFFKSFTNLHGCKELEHALTEEGQTISLRSLTLIKLPKLCGSVFQIKQHLEFPSLQIIKIEDCPMLEKFSLGSLHLPKLKSVSGMLNHEFAANFFYHGEMSDPDIHLENNYYIISVKDISFSYNYNVKDCQSYFLKPDPSGRRFVDAISLPWTYGEGKIVGKFKTEKIMSGIVYEIMLVIMTDEYGWENPIEIELNVFRESELQKRTEYLGNQPIDTWTEISIGKFMMREPQQINEEFKFSLRQRNPRQPYPPKRRLSIKGVKIVEV